jgi:hypothetical protein
MMPIPAKEAAAIAKKHGLSLPDARALSMMADTTDEAEKLAADFAEGEVDYQKIADDISNRNSI